MSKLIVEVCEVKKIEPHPNADKLAIAKIKGWTTCIQKNPETGETQFQEGEKCIYFPPDSVIPPYLANSREDTPPGRLGIAKYCNPLRKDASGWVPPGYRVRAANLRGQRSYGVVMKIDPAWGDNPHWQVGDNVADHFHVTKWEPPMECTDGDAEVPCVLFHRYTDIENYGNYPLAIPEGTEVVVLEKIHGKNSRVGYVFDSNDEGERAWVWMAGSHDLRRKEFTEKGIRSEFWHPLDEKMKEMLEHLQKDAVFSVVVFGEIYGSGVQDMWYGYQNGYRGYRVFDIAIDEKYLDYDDVVASTKKFDIEMVPELYRGSFSQKVIDDHTDGLTTVCDPSKAGKFRGREGIVVKPVKEQFSDVLNGRMIVKSKSPDFESRGGKQTDFH